jgi:hypothetical protein
MKLYTEEQVRQAMIAGIHIGYSNQFNMDNINNDVDKAMKYRTPIELPSDDEIEEISRHEILYNDSKRGWWLEGANYILNVIKTQYEKDN